MDGAAVGSPAAFGEVLRLVWLTPASDGPVRRPGGRSTPVPRPARPRRRFRLMARGSARWSARLRSRNRLLEDERADTAWLDAIEREVAETGVAVAAARRETVERLAGLIAAGRDDASPFPWAGIALTGPLDAELARAPAVDVEDLYRGWLRARARRGTGPPAERCSGPQASDLASITGPRACRPGRPRPASRRRFWSGSCWPMRGSVAAMTRDRAAGPARRGRRPSRPAPAGRPVRDAADPRQPGLDDVGRSRRASPTFRRAAQTLEVTPGRIVPIRTP